MTGIDEAMLNFSPASLMLLNAILAVVMFSIALDLRMAQFRALIKAPRPLLAGFFAQFLALPAVTFGLVLLFQPRASIALGLILVAACPGGNISNYLSHRAGGNTALSVSMTAIATVAAIILTPLNIALWGGLYAPTRAILVATQIDPVQVAITVIFMLVLPLALGMMVNARLPDLATRIRRPAQLLSMVIFIGFIIAALASNWQYFLDLAGKVAGLVAVHNAVALGLGFTIATLAGLSPRDRRSITIETGIQNSGLGLILIFAFFGGLGGMAVVAAFWGMWHAITGLVLALLWARRLL
ncbi:bile acid:sodium symporter family protein [Pararhodobacter oceanensis]|uniref:Symporter n=1 Tax=Pararhodobacter oceanensis TaxID=2172121 RepID=A0A2T8HYU1_9RHOB|nr:bile acid:sodium symporter family protein [Pararhodobacter oceanensis]PVH30512.1 symporter [Pararhodobacter oceanensis]